VPFVSENNNSNEISCSHAEIVIFYIISCHMAIFSIYMTRFIENWRIGREREVFFLPKGVGSA
jgi:hypothetical protein